MNLEEKLKELQDRVDAVALGTGIHQVPYTQDVTTLLAVLRECRKQRDQWATWYIDMREGRLSLPIEQTKDDKTLLAILNGEGGTE